MKNSFINDLDKIIFWPKKPQDKEFVIKHLSEKFIFSKIYSEKDVNDIIRKYHLFNDVPLLRRELISRKFLNRKDDGSEYWKLVNE